MYMKKEDKELLLKDISARLPYGVIAHYILLDKYSLIGRVYLWSDSGFYIKKTDKYSNDWTWNYETATSCAEFDKFKPYLRPMSSMTEEEKKIYNGFVFSTDEYGKVCESDDVDYLRDWLDANYFDHRRLIPKGLALEAPEGMYDFK